MEETSPSSSSLINNAAKWGMISAAIGIVITILLYVVDYTLMVQLKFALFSLLLYMGIVVYAGITYRKSVGGFLDFKNAFLHGFAIFAISGLISIVFQIVLYNVVDTELPAKLVDASVENAQAIMEKFGTPADAMDEALEKARTDAEGRFTIGGLLKGYLIGIIVSAVLALITGLIVRKREPVGI